MGASNFHYENTSRIYSFDVNDQDDYDWYKESLNDQLKTLERNTKGLSYYPGSGKDTEELRSYPSHVIGTLTMYKMYANVELQVNLIAVARSGYHSGACLDFVWNYNLNGNEWDNTEWAEDFEYYGEHNGNQLSAARAAYITKFAAKWAEATKDKMVELLESVFEANTLALVKVATFSNGESIYQRADGKPFERDEDPDDDGEDFE